MDTASYISTLKLNRYQSVYDPATVRHVRQDAQHARAQHPCRRIPSGVLWGFKRKILEGWRTGLFF